MDQKIYNVLFICRGNAARSIIAEGLLTGMGKGQFRAFSAGAQPRGEVSPFAIQALADLFMPVEGFRSKSWDEFSGPNAPQMDFVFTLCDQTAGEACPVWPGGPLTAHWGVEDPLVEGATPEQVAWRSKLAAISLKRRIELFLALPWQSIDRAALATKLQEIGGV
jgi:arsenate reductase